MSNTLRAAWLSLLAIPVAFVVLVLTSGLLVASWGIQEGQRVPPALLSILIPLIAAILGLPALLSYYFARRARAEGVARAYVPVWIASAVAALGVAVNLAAYFLSW